jgi:hypothetical protein
MKTREELNSAVNIEILAELQKKNEPVLPVNPLELKREAYRALMKPKPFSTFGNSSVE